MKKQLFILGTMLMGLTLVNQAMAHGGDISCNEPKAEWKKQTELQKKLEADGWKIRKVQTENGCYEVYGFDENKKRVEVFFNPKTFEKVGEVKQND